MFHELEEKENTRIREIPGGFVFVSIFVWKAGSQKGEVRRRLEFSLLLPFPNCKDDRQANEARSSLTQNF